MATEQKVTHAQVKVALSRCQSELTAARRALESGQGVELRNAFERLQHRAYEGKALFQGEDLPDE